MKVSRALITLALFASVATVTPAAAATPGGGSRPTVEHFAFAFGPFPDEILTPTCGFRVTTTISVHGVDISFDDGHPSGLIFLSTFRNQVTFSANGRSVAFVERGHESIRLRDGVIVDAISGRNFGLDTIGRFVFRIDPATGELLSTSSTGRSVDEAALCDALSA